MIVTLKEYLFIKQSKTNEQEHFNPLWQQGSWYRIEMF